MQSSQINNLDIREDGQSAQICASVENTPAISGGYAIGNPMRYPGLRNADKATESRLTRLLAAIRTGHGLHHAAALAGISADTLKSWRDLDPAFSADLQQAAAEFAEMNLAKIGKASDGDWKASAWLLRSSPLTREVYGETGNTKSSGVTVVLNIDRDREGVTIDGEPA